MDQETKQRIAEVFQRNLDNRLSVDVCNGMLQSILNILENNRKEEEES